MISMIEVKRTETPACLMEDGVSDGALETQRAIHHFTHGLAGKFDFSAYKEAKEELNKMFNGKCAYCESRIEHTSFMEVEHFRPKGYVQGEPRGSHGYYWLGSKWENLLLSCEKCNSKKYKGNHFPLRDPQKRVKHHTGNLSEEEPLLLNPCEEDPEDHIIFDELGDIHGTDIKGKKSVIHYGLKREELRKERARHLKDLDKDLILLSKVIEDFNKNKSDNLEDIIKMLILSFNEKRKDDSQFSALTRWYVEVKFSDLRESLGGIIVD